MKNAGNKLADIEHQIDEIYDYQFVPNFVEQKLIDLEDKSRRNNLRVDGILETSGETGKGCEEKMQQVFQEKLSLECRTEIAQAHETSSKQSNTNNRNNPNTIICNLLRHKDKLKILQKANKLRRTNIFINKDFIREKWNCVNSSGKK